MTSQSGGGERAIIAMNDGKIIGSIYSYEENPCVSKRPKTKKK